MASGQISRQLEFANMQMAAEAFLARADDAVPNRPPEEQIATRLEVGNFHRSTFMPVQAEQFVEKYEVLAQYRNDPLLGGGSGFSGTLFRNRTTGELTLSFRSTEFIDDAVRDTKATSAFEIKDQGWAFGQISEMEKWYAELRADPSLLGGKVFNVTGYSLGGHLATAFTMLRREQANDSEGANPILETYTFNGAGTGSVLNGRCLTDIIADFDRIRGNYEASPEWLSLSEQDQTDLRNSAQFAIDAINAERFRVAGLSGVTRAFNTSAPAGEQVLFGYQIAALLVGRDTMGAFASNPFPNTPVFADLKIPNLTEIVGMETDGEATSFASNSGIHHGSRQEITIEAQPLFRGNFPSEFIDSFFKLLVDNPGDNDFADTHSLVLLVDSLSLMAAMEALDPGFTSDTAKKIFDAASNTAAATVVGAQGTAEGDTLERILDALHELLTGQEAELPLDYASSLDGNTWHLEELRTPFHERLAEVRLAIEDMTNALGAPSYAIKSLTSLSAASLIKEAGLNDATGKAYRYALKELNPFVLTGNDDLYAAHNISGELNLYDRESGVGMTQQYLAERAAMLAWRIKDNEANGEQVLRADRIETYQYIDRTLKDVFDNDLTVTISGTQIAAVNTPVKVIFGSDMGETLTGENVYIGDRLFGGAGDDTLVGEDGNDQLEGGTGWDLIKGGFGRDIVLGGDGDDVLEGNEDGDNLDGGRGFDLYLYRAGDGYDVISDEDGRGRIEYDGIILTGGKRRGESVNYWQSDDKAFSYSLYSESDGSASLGIQGAGGSILVKDFADGVLGIKLEEDASSSPSAPPETVREIRGDLERQVFINPDLSQFPPGSLRSEITSTPAINDYWVIDELGNFIRDPARPLTEPDGIHDLWGSAGSDHMIASEFGNSIFANGGDDYIQGGTGVELGGGGDGDDFAELGAFRDIPLEDWLNVSIPFPEATVTGAGDDVFGGGAGDDVIFGGVAADLDALLDPATPAAGHKGDWLSGMEGDDLLYGSTGDDLFTGGPGGDEIIGGPGNDVLDGDDFFFSSHDTFISAATAVWQISFGPAPFDISFFPVSVTPLTNFSEWYYKLAGGDDALFGGGGNDVLVGMLGDDLLQGDEGDDTLSGWEGADKLLGGDGEDLMAGEFGRYEQTDDRLLAYSNSVTPGFLDLSTGTSGPVELVGNDLLDGGAGNDTLYGEGGEDVLLGGEGNDELWGDASYLPDEIHAADFMEGGAGDDVLQGGGGNDMLIGGAGNDYLHGGNGADTYIFERGSGQDVVSDAGESGTDAVLVNDYARGEIVVLRDPNGAIVLKGAETDQITISSMAKGEGFGIEEILFADGTRLTGEDLAALPVDESFLAGPEWETFSDGNDVIETSGMSVDAGAGDDVIFGAPEAVVYGGGGKDTITGGSLLMGGEGDDYISDGSTSFGGPGGDKIVNGSIMDGGEGDDILNGGAGADRYLINPADTGRDLIQDSGGSANEFLDAYYGSLGIEDWRSLLGVTSTQYVIWQGEGPTFDTEQEAREFFEAREMTLEQALANGELEIVEPLPAAPEVAANDYAALDVYYQSGLIEFDIVEFGEGVALDGLSFDWGEALADLHTLKGDEDSTHLTLEITASAGGAVAVAIPYPDDPVGSGIELFAFADGALYSLAQLLEFAPAMPDFIAPVVIAGTEQSDTLVGTPASERILGKGGGDDIHGDAGNDEILGGDGDDFLEGGAGDDVLRGDLGQDTYRFNLGDGMDSIFDAGGVDTLAFGNEITPDGLALGLGSLLIQVSDSDAIHIEGFNPDDVLGSEVVEFFEFSNGVTLTYEQLIAAGFDIDGTAAADVLFGTNVDDRIVGSGGDDSMIGNEGDDTYFVSIDSGSDYIEDSGGEDAVRFGEGIGPDDLTATAGGAGWTLSFHEQALSLRWNEIEHFEFFDGTVLTAGDIVGLPVIPGTDDDDYLVGSEQGEWILGLEGSDLLYGESGDDKLEGGAGSDQLEGGDGNDFLDGGAGNDKLVGDSGADTYLFGRGFGHDYITDEDDAIGNVDVIQMVAGVSPANIVATSDLRGSLHLGIEGTPDVLTVYDWFTRDTQKIERIEFSDGTVWGIADVESRIVPAIATPYDDGLSGSEGSDFIRGLGGNDEMFDFAGDDVLYGDEGNDFILDTAGHNYLSGGAGDDYLYSETATLFAGGAGTDIVDSNGSGNLIAFNRGDGRDTAYFYPWNGHDRFTLSLGGGIGLSDLNFTRENDYDLVIGLGAGEWIQLAGWYGGDPAPGREGVLQVIADDIRTYDLSGAIALFDAARAADPSVGEWAAGDALAGNALDVSADGVIGGEIAYHYARNDGDLLSFVEMIPVLADPDFGYFPQIVVPAQEDVNRPPVVTSVIADQEATEDQVFTFVVGQDVFADPDEGDVLLLSAELANGMPLPSWLGFDAATGYLSGTPGNGDVGAAEIVVTATDSGGLSVGAPFAVEVLNVNDGPVVTGSLMPETVLEDELFVLAFSSELFSDEDVADTLALTATLASGAPLPSWMSFDPLGGLMIGLPGNEDVGAYEISLTASDEAGATAVAPLQLTVQNVNDAPLAIAAMETQVANQNASFSFTVPAETFADFDAGDELTLTAALSDGSPLPAWLTFASETGSFSGAPSEHEAGAYDLTVYAADNSGEVAESPFQLVVSDAAVSTKQHIGTRRADVISTGFDNDIIHTGAGNDLIQSGAGRDFVRAGQGSDSIDGGAGRDYLFGGSGWDSICGGSGNDVIFACDGGGYVNGGADADLLVGDAGMDGLHGGGGSNVMAGGKGGDLLAGGSGHDVFLFNRGDGGAVLRTGEALPENTDTLSLGAGIDAGDILLRREGEDLAVKVDGTGDAGVEAGVQILLEDWYDATVDQMTVKRLQFVGDQIRIYDFESLIARFDAETAGGSDDWRAAEALEEVLLSVTETEAIGGALSYAYAVDGHFKNLSIPTVQAVLSDPGLGISLQPVADEGGQTLEPYLAAEGDVAGGQQTLADLVGDAIPTNRNEPDQRGDLYLSSPRVAMESFGRDRERGDKWEKLVQGWFEDTRNDGFPEMAESTGGAFGSGAGGFGAQGTRLTQHEMAASWRRTRELLDAHLARDGLASAGVNGESLPVSDDLLHSLRFGGARTANMLPGLAAGHQLRTLEGLDEGLARLGG